MKEVEFVFVTNYYDQPLNGLCIVNGDLCEFELVYDFEEPPEHEYYNIYKFTTFGKYVALYQKKMFELCVGEHWSFKQKPFKMKPILFNFYFDIYSPVAKKFRGKCDNIIYAKR